MSALAIAQDVNVGELLLHVVGTRFKARVDTRITDGRIERTMDGAPTLELDVVDFDRSLVRSGIFDRQIDLRFDHVWWRLTQVSKVADALTLTFEDRAVSYLREGTSPRTALRSKMTRAEFALSLVKEVKKGGGIPFICPELHTVPPVETAAQAKARETGDPNAKVSAGLPPGTKYSITHGDGSKSVATKQQVANAERVMAVAAGLGANIKATLALLEAVQIESSISNLSGGDADSRGILQVRDQTAAGMRLDNRDIEACCTAFLKRGFWHGKGAMQLSNEHPDWSAGRVAQECQGSAFPERYDKAEADARAFLADYSGDPKIAALPAASDPSGGAQDLVTVGASNAGPYQFQRGGTDGTIETTWDCLERLAGDVNWRRFVVDGACWFISETALAKRKPAATLTEDDVEVLGIDFDVDNGKVDSSATVTVRATRPSFPPGSVVVIKGCGPANGRWLVGDASRSLFDPTATLTLHRPTQVLPEPIDDGGGDSADSAATSDTAATDTSSTATKVFAHKREKWPSPTHTFATRVSGPSSGLLALQKYLVAHGGLGGGPAIDYPGHVGTSYHYSGWALDIGDGSAGGKPTPKVLAKTWDLLQPLVPILDELFWNSGGFYKHGAKFDEAGSDAVSGHRDHIHVAYSGSAELLAKTVGEPVDEPTETRVV